ncbi:MAG: orotate phosphoribosyltransferase [Xanthobacteraceae bacterium]|nr:orotate phosphoribosyltransferase [Xanthobacteraceae bacterium]
MPIFDDSKSGRIPRPGQNPLTQILSLPDSKAARARLKEIIAKRSFGLGEITLASGRKSHFYFNLKPTMLDPEGAALLAQLSLEALADEKLDALGGLEMGAVPISGAVAALSFIAGKPLPNFFVRKKPKEHGAKLLVEGLLKGESLAGKNVAIVEDVTTTGESALKAAQAAQESGAKIGLVLTIVDRQEGAAETFSKAGLRFRALFTADEFLKPQA